MGISFLYKIPETETSTPENTIYNLSLDRTIELVCSDIRAGRFFLSVAARPLRLKENIFYRREIADDFLKNSELYYELSDILGKFYDVNQQNEREKKLKYSVMKGNDSKTKFQNIKQVLQMSAQTTKSFLELMDELNELLEKKELHSQGFNALRSFTSKIVNGEGFSEMMEICRYFKNIDEINSAQSCISLDENCCINLSRLASLNNQKPQEKKKSGLPVFVNFQKRHTQTARTTTLRLPSISLPLGSSIMLEAFSEPAKHMQDIVTSLYDEIAAIRDELLFYKAQMKFIMFLKEKNIPFVYPEITDDSVFECDGLLDTFLTAYYPIASSVVANDAHIGNGNNGILVFGGNNTGKTVYLRSIGTAQILAQAGFPVTAKNAIIGIRSGIFTQFASGEKEFEEGNEAGRFEQEVREIACVVENSDERALVLFNETFQTTAYSEGAEGLYHILRYLSEKKTNWVLVTHLSGLCEKFNDDVSILKTSKGYKLVSEKSALPSS